MRRPMSGLEEQGVILLPGDERTERVKGRREE